MIILEKPLDPLSLNGELLGWEGNGSLASLDSLAGLVLLGEGTSDGSGLLHSQVLWNVLLSSVESSDRLSLLQVDHSENSGDVLSNLLDLWKRRSAKLLHLQSGQLLLQVDQLLLELFLRLCSQFACLDCSLLVSIVVRITRWLS